MTKPYATPSPSRKVIALGKYSSLLHPSQLEEQEQEQEKSVPAKTHPGRDMDAEMEESGKPFKKKRSKYGHCPNWLTPPPLRVMRDILQNVTKQRKI